MPPEYAQLDAVNWRMEVEKENPDVCTLGSSLTKDGEFIMDTGASRDLAGKDNITDATLETVYYVHR